MKPSKAGGNTENANNADSTYNTENIKSTDSTYNTDSTDHNENKNDMNKKENKIIILSPPFYSHFQPLKTLGKALKSLGARVSIACSEGFQEEIEEAGLGFHPLDINKNRNTGIAKKTEQDQEEQKRLEEFFEATYRGPVKTLITQADHRLKDMFSNPRELIDSIQKLYDLHQPDLMIVDQLSYGATLALIGLDIPFLTFCPPHPKTIQSKEVDNGLTERWPKALEPTEREKQALRKKQEELNSVFAGAYKKVFSTRFPHRSIPTDLLNNPFSLTSPKGVLFNYPEFSQESSIPAYYLHYCFEPEELEESFKIQVSEGSEGSEDLEGLDGKKRRVLISFGTFLSERKDVIDTLIQGFLNHGESWHIYAATGGNEEFFSKYSSESITKAPFLPQKALIPHMDLVVHHGGTNSFTETLYYGKPMIILPFSSDQFAVAYDVEKNHIGAVLDPNHLTEKKLHHAIGKLEREEVKRSLEYWREKSREKGPHNGAKWIMRILKGPV